MSLSFRQGGSADVEGVAHLASHSFPALGFTHAEWVERIGDSPFGDTDNLWLAEEAGRLVAGSRMYRFEQWIGGARFPMMGLGLVTNSAAHRRRGIASDLVASGLRHSRERGDVVSVLYPFRTSFYQRLGYGMAGRVNQYRFAPKMLKDFEERSRVAIVDSDKDRADVRAVYDRWAPTQNGMMVRRDRQWEPVWRGRHGVIVRDQKGEATGYAVFAYSAEAARGGRFIEIVERAWLDHDARRALYGWFSSLSDQWDFLLYRAHPDEPFEEHLAEIRLPAEGIARWGFWFPSAVVQQGPMFRILDLQKAWAGRPIRAAEPLVVRMRVDDPQIRENSGDFDLVLDGANAEIRSPAGKFDLRLAIGISALSRLFIGSLRLRAAIEAGLARVDDFSAVDAFQHAIDLPSPWMFDNF